MRVLHRVADAQEQLQRVGYIQRLRAHEPRDWQSVDEFHREVCVLLSPIPPSSTVASAGSAHLLGDVLTYMPHS